ncbi:nucleoside triphosphate pyrophosphohydrolase [Leptospira ilyithenensis]|uniref:Nucleoside triphosphate pyrophosphohydrolase n=2 Tax=Leptospira ilyithenensis TaxID=2484901 RepID=A0A4R9LML5_9LEPT|nr:nucleoside triphosphate pyrophosphohydrolase [Leptospira ilyithenensis]TGN07210.1 nucleoside triphosphate pyrophosphohydrolase [Leptospira ilyithenensis]
MLPPSSPSPIQNLLQLTADLRSENGCPWDKEQNHSSVIPCLLEESYEVVDTIERKDDTHLREELGDLLFQVVFHCQLASERGAFNWDEVVSEIVEKLVRRHPHVYESVGNIKDSEGVLGQWDEIKKKEKADKAKRNGIGGEVSVLDGIPLSLPSIQRSEKIQSKVAKQGFDWENVSGVFEKFGEEIKELEEAIGQNADPGLKKIPYSENIEEEVGDLFFLLVNLSRKLSLDPETTLRKANEKFERRFRLMEDLLSKKKEVMKGKSLEELDLLWNQSKEILKQKTV